MVRFSVATLAAAALAALSVVSGVSAHGYMDRPTPRAIEKAANNLDDLRNPNTRGKCRGEPEGKITNVSGSVTLGLNISAEHEGPCEVYLLDRNLGNDLLIASKMDCARPTTYIQWTVPLPAGVTGRKVLRWVWTAKHIPAHEHYEQCADINIVGPGSGVALKAGGPAGSPSPSARSSRMATIATGQATVGLAGQVKRGDAAGPPPSSGSCKPGEFKCEGNKIGQCASGSFVWTTCSGGLTCRGEGGAVHCGS